MLQFLAANQYVIGLTVVGFVIASVLMILIVLVQRPQGGGLSDAFGAGSGSGATAFGAKTGDALTTGTIGIFIIFIALAISLNFMIRPSGVSQQAGITGDAPAAPAQGTQQTRTTTPVDATNEEGETLDLTPIDDPFQQPPDGQQNNNGTGGGDSDAQDDGTEGAP